MIKKTIPFILVLMLAFVGACSNEDVMPQIDSGLTGRTITFTASMPDEDGPSTRISAGEAADGTIGLTWNTDDKIDLLFVQGTTKINGSATVENIVAEGKKATFTVFIPDTINENEPFNLYGVYGGGAVSTTNPEQIALPAIEGTTLNENNVGKNIMLRFANTVDANGAIGGVSFQHVGFLFTAKIKVTATGTIDAIKSVQLLANEAWAYNSTDVQFNIETKEFTRTGSKNNSATFQFVEKNADMLTVRSWFPKANAAWPALSLSIKDGTTDVVSTTQKSAGNTPTVGKAYYLYATWNGTDLVFVDKDFNEPVAGTKIDIADLRETFVKGETYAEDHFIEGEVVLNAENGNVNASAAYVADETAGISFFFTSGDDVVTDAPLGAKVRINLEGATWDSYNGLIQLKSLSTSTAVEILEPTATTPLEPRVVTIQELLDGKYQSELVQVNNVQFKNVPATYGSNPDLIDNNAIEINVRSSSGATFKDENVPEGNGPFIGVVGMYNNAQLHVRETADLAGMTGPRYVPPFINVNPFSLTFAKEAGSETIAVTANVAWTATSDAAWATISPANGTNDGAIAVSVEANAGADARTATITITDGDVVTTVNVTQAGTSETFATDLFFSEYIEGSSNNKYLEIYNGTGVSVNLSDYKIVQYNNGKSTATAAYTLELSGTLEHDKVYVIANNLASTSIYSGADLTTNSYVMGFNGNDAIVLVKNTTRIDIIGEIGNKADIIKDVTLIRKPHVKEGNAENYSGFPKEIEWSIHGTDYQELGSHTTEY